MAETLVDDGQVLESTTVQIYRTATVVKGGRRFSFGALVVVGDRQGNVGIGYGKAPGVPGAIEKAQKVARKSLAHVTLLEGTLPHEVTARFGASLVKLVPAAPGTGVIAGATVRTVLELAGVRDCLTKSFGSNNQKNLLKATFEGLKGMRTKEQIGALRGQELPLTEVEERIEAGRRYAPTVSTAPALEAPKGPGRTERGRGRGDKGRGRGRGGRGGGPGRDAAPTVQVPAPQATGTPPPATDEAPPPAAPPAAGDAGTTNDG